MKTKPKLPSNGWRELTHEQRMEKLDHALSVRWPECKYLKDKIEERIKKIKEGEKKDEPL